MEEYYLPFTDEEIERKLTLVDTYNEVTTKSISTLDATPTDYLAHLYTITGYAQNQQMPNNADGEALWKINGLTATNLVSGESVANGGSVSFSSVLNNKYYDTLNNVVLTGTGSTMTATNSSGATASMMIIDLNACGLQTKTNTELAVIFPYYFDGTRSTLAGLRLFGRGKNLFDKSKATLGYYINSSGNLVALASLAVTEYIPVLAGKTYVKNNTSVQEICLFNKSKVLVGYTTSASFTPTLDGFVRLTLSISVLDTFQLELGSTAAPYEPYLSSTAYTPQGTLRSVPSASDSVDMGADGKTRLTQRVSGDYALVAANVVNMRTTYTNVDMAEVSLPSNAKTLGSGTTQVVLFGYDRIDFRTGAGDYSTTDIGRYFESSSNVVRVLFAKGTTLAAAQAALAGTVIRYELATPIVTEIETIGKLQAYPNGSILAEPCYNGYATGATTVIGTAELPIKGINKVESVSLDANGNAVRTDVTASCSVDATTLTIAGYDATKVYFYDLDIDTKYTTTGLKTYQVECPTAVVTHDFGAGSTAWTLTANEAKANYLSCTNAGGAANVIIPAKDGKMYVLKNASGQTLTVKTASSTGITIANTKIATFIYIGTDFVKTSEV